MDSKIKAGFEYTLQHYSPDGDLVDQTIVHNLIPNVGRAYILGRTFGSTAQVGAWYMGLIGAAAYTPAYTDDMAYLVANAQEITAYDAGTRIALDAAQDSSSSWSTNTSCEFTMTSAADVYGAFIGSTQAFGASTGTLLSEVKMPSPKSMESGSVLRVHAQIVLIT